MTTKNILSLLETKNQNLPVTSIRHDFKNNHVVIVPVVEKEEKSLEKTFPFAKKEKIKGKNGEKTNIIRNNQVFLFVGIGPKDKITPRKIRRFYGSMYLSVSSNKPSSIGFYCPMEWLEAAAIGVDVAALNPTMLKPTVSRPGGKPKKEDLPEVFFTHPDFKKDKNKATKLMKAGQLIAGGKNIMRLLGAIPPNELSTKAYSDVILALAKKWKVKCEKIPQKKLTKYNLLHAVSQGSQHNSELLVFTLHPKKGKSKKTTAVVGKGLCYDSGGLQGKQSFMKYMKEDMAGSASVLGTIYTIAKGKLNLKQTTYFLLPLAENMMGSKAMRADDVYVAGDGQSVEIIHTDAEGRLVMADAICYAKNNYKKTDQFYTIATLTGSCIIALGEHYTGGVCNNMDLGHDIMKMSKEVGDFVHVGPWDMDYDDNNSPNASMANLGENDREAGWIKAGMFLYRFVPKAKKEKEQAKFCHFDIAATIDMNEKGKPWRRKGFSSGVGVGVLSKLLTK